MKLQALTITRGYAYGEQPAPLLGTVTLADNEGNEQKVKLSPGAISRIIATVAAEVHGTAVTSANRTNSAMKAASEETIMLAQDGQLMLDKQP